MNPGRVKTHIMREHPTVFDAHYPGQAVQYYPCTVDDCGMLADCPRAAALKEHMSQVHGVDPAHSAKSNDPKLLQRKRAGTLRDHLAADASRLNAFEDRIAAAEAHIRGARPGWVPDHGLNVTKNYPTKLNAMPFIGSVDQLVKSLSKLRTELAYVGGENIGSALNWNAVAETLETQVEMLVSEILGSKVESPAHGFAAMDRGRELN